MQATNLDERKILTFREANQFGPNNFRIKDDVDNVIRGVNFGFSLKVIGALKLEDIEPGKTVSHVQVFSMPPPKTEHLVLTVDLKCFGLTDEVKFLIPGSAIAR